jgi:predicted dehydrogenase
MVHWIDVAHWILNNDRPERAVTIGNFVTAQDVWQTPDTIQTVLQYPNNVQMYFEGTFCNARNGAMIELMGSEGTMYIDRGRFELTPEPRGNQRPEEQILNEGARGRDFYPRPDGELLHLTNWIESIRNNRQPSAPIAAGVSAAAAAHLANQAYRQNRVAVAQA